MIETDYHNHTARTAAPSYRVKRGIEWDTELEPIAVPREDGFRVEIDAFARMVEEQDRSAIDQRRAASIDNAWTPAAILDSART